MPKFDPNHDREVAKYGTPIASREFILEQIEKNDSPLSYGELLKICQVSSDDLKVALKRRLRAMERDGQLLFTKFKKYAIPDQKDFIVGQVIGHRDGFGFLQPENAKNNRSDWYISHSQMRSYIHGDIVRAQSLGEFKGKTEARIVDLVTARSAPLIGRYFIESGVQSVVPDDSRIKHEIIIPKGSENGARHGQMVIVEIESRPNRSSSATGSIREVLGEHMAPGMEIDIALRNYEIPFEWSDTIVNLAKKLSPEVSEQDKLDRVDLRKLPLVTIDGEDSRDFDDAVYCERKKSGGWRLYVAIADVSHYVKHNSALDREAIDRGNSVYFPSQVIPMLPEALSNGLCSLNPQVDRLCLVAEMTIADSGKLSGFKFYEAVMHSHARLTYTKVAAILDGDATMIDRYQGVYPHLMDLFDLYKALKLRRAERGAFEFDTIEAKFIFNAYKKIDSVETVERNDAHKLIEECMILANVATAKFLEKNDAGALFRVHDKPDPTKLASFRAFLAELGGELTFSDQPTPKELSDQVNPFLNRPDSELIQTMMIRSMRQAVYQPDNIGHFGLALDGYAHFTSPIRRYPDLIVHRAIKGVLHKQGEKTSGHYAYSDEELEYLGEQCSKTERRADDATRDVESWLKCEFMQDHIDREYEGIIASVTSFGVFVRLKELHIEGLVHITGLGNDYFNYDQGRHVLVGERTRQVFRLGDELDVRVRSVDLDGRQIDFELADLPRGSSRDRLAGKSRKPQTKNGRPASKGKAGAEQGSNEQSKSRRGGSIRERLKRGDVPVDANVDGAKKEAPAKGKNAADGKTNNGSKPAAKPKATKKKHAKKKASTSKPKTRAAKRIAAKKAKKSQ